MTQKPDFSGGVDHIHLYAPDREAAAKWYEEVLGFEVVEHMAFWAKDPGGPLTLQNPKGAIHLAVFRSDKQKPFSLAFGASGEEYLQWRTYLKTAPVSLAEKEHQISWSLYFNDPYGNEIEITTYDYDAVSASA